MNKDDFDLLSGFLPNEKLTCVKTTIDLALADLESYKDTRS